MMTEDWLVAIGVGLGILAALTAFGIWLLSLAKAADVPHLPPEVEEDKDDWFRGL